MDQRDWWWLLASVGLLAAGQVLHARVLRRHEEQIAQLRYDLRFQTIAKAEDHD